MSLFDLPRTAPAPAVSRPAPTALQLRSGSETLTRIFALAFDEIDYGILLVDGSARVLHVNHAARDELDDSHPLFVDGAELLARSESDVLQLHEALTASTQRGLRRLLTLGEGAERVNVTVVPLPTLAPGQPAATMLMLGRRRVCEQLSVLAFARGAKLTPAETRVLEALCEDVPPSRIAARQGVAVCTVRSQIGSIRVKTGAVSIRDLVGRVARLPPMVQALRGRAGAPTAARATHA